jgi:hypothetical protein
MQLQLAANCDVEKKKNAAKLAQARNCKRKAQKSSSYAGTEYSEIVRWPEKRPHAQKSKRYVLQYSICPKI